MHPESHNEMKKFVETLDKSKPLRIADVGSYDVNGTYRSLFSGVPGWIYIGLDISKGVNVDTVLASAYQWSNVASNQFDIVISGQTLEHVPQPWNWIREVARILKPGGFACIIAPHTFGYHAFPVDCWRVWPDGMKGLFEYVNLTPVKIYKTGVDTIGIGMKRLS